MADRAILLDHLLRGRFMLGLGPGALPTDAAMIGIDPADQRQALEEDTQVLVQLLRHDAPVTKKTARYNLVEPRCQLRPFTDPCFEIGVAAIASPSGPRLAGRYGVGLLSVGATIQGGFDALHLHWDVMEERAAEFGTWSVGGAAVGRCASPRCEQALKDVEYGIEAWFDYLQETAAAPAVPPLGDTLEERVAWVNESGVGVIGTPEDAVTRSTSCTSSRTAGSAAT